MLDWGAGEQKLRWKLSWNREQQEEGKESLESLQSPTIYHPFEQQV